MKNIEMKKENGIISVTSPFDRGFIGEVKTIGGKWNAGQKTWDVPEENEEMLKELLTRCYGWADDDAEIITIEYCTDDFYDDVISIGSIKMVDRRFRDGDVSYYNDTIVLSGGFPSSGGSAKHPAAEPKDGTILRSKISRKAFDQLSEEEQKKITIVKEASKKERLEAEKAKLIARLAEIEKELEGMEG